MFRMRFYLALSVMLLVTITMLAQNDECSALVQTALDSVADFCDETGRNQVCYGNVQLDATVVDDAPDFSFEAPGDLADVALIESLQLSVLRSPDEWGIALMKIQANLPDTVPGQNVTMLLFGDVVIENQADEMEDEEAFGPMQAFVFRSGVGELACDEAPQDGILIQTPTGAGTVTLDVNNVRIELGSTAFLNAVPDGLLTITMLEGEATITAEGVTIIVPAGLRAEIPLDADGLASGAPEIVPYEAEDVANVPIGNLDEVIEFPEPLTLADVADVTGDAGAGSGVSGGDFIIPQAGIWCGSLSDSCNDLSSIIVSVDETGLTVIEPIGLLPRVGDNIYSKVEFEANGVIWTWTIEILSPTEMIITITDHDDGTTTVETATYAGDEGDAGGDFIVPQQGTWCNPELDECNDLTVLILDIDETGLTSVVGFIPRIGDNFYSQDNVEVSEGIFWDISVEVFSSTELEITIFDPSGDPQTSVNRLVYAGE